jgi:hypothetical protein
LVRSNTFRNYVLYAFGEILLVMVGILLALQVNNWNEARKSRREEAQILTALREEFSGNLAEVHRSIEVARMIQSKCDLLLDNTGEQGIKLTHSESDSLIMGGIEKNHLL